MKLRGLEPDAALTSRRSRHWLVARTRLYRFIDFIGRWSSIDLFMISILVALVQFGELTRVRPQGGAMAFAAVVVVTMFASRCFDPRVMWDVADGSDMNVPTDTPPTARSRPRRWFSWIWLTPLIALSIVSWLTIRALAERGPLITISFSDAEGIQAGDTKIRHKDVDLGTVESIYLSRDMSRVFVRARMRRSVSAHLNASTRFWIVRPRVGVAGISGLSTLVSGSYIEMYPSPEQENAKPQRSFVGLDDPPALTPDTPGRSFTLRTDDLGSLTGGSPVSYRGVPVGEVEGFQLDPSGKQISVFAFVRAPYQKYVTSQTRFWNSGGIDVAVGVQGLRFRASSWQQLISGGVSFDTPDSAQAAPESQAGAIFRLYENQYNAQREPRGHTLVYRARFPGGGGDIGPGSSVQLEGAEVGEVTDSRLQFDDASQSLITRVTIEIDPSRLEIVNGRTAISGDPAQALEHRLANLVTRGLRAHLVAANFLTGNKVVALDMMHHLPPRTLHRWTVLRSFRSRDPPISRRFSQAFSNCCTAWMPRPRDRSWDTRSRNSIAH